MRVRRIGILVMLLCSLLVACGGETPRSVVEQALEYQITHPLSARQGLLGIEQLQAQISLSRVRVTQDQTLILPGEQGHSWAGHHLEGTYTLRVNPEEGRRFFRRKEPFQLTLAQIGEEEKTWVLAYPKSGSLDSETWTTLEFLPRPPAPSEQPAGSNLPDQITKPLEDRTPQEIPYLEESDQRYSAIDS